MSLGDLRETGLLTDHVQDGDRPTEAPKNSLEELDEDEDEDEDEVPPAAEASPEEKFVEVTDEEAEEIRAEQERKRQESREAEDKRKAREKKEDKLWEEWEVTQPARKAVGKLVVPFTQLRKPGVPARDRPGREPPMPKAKIFLTRS